MTEEAKTTAQTVGLKRKGDAEEESPSKKQKIEQEQPQEQPVGSKRKGDDSQKANPAKKPFRKQKRYQPCEIRRKIQEFFKDKDISDPQLIKNFFEENGVTKFGDFYLPERSLKVFVEEHGLVGQDGKICAPPADFTKKKLREQMEFYFSDANLPNDDFMMKEIQKSEERWVQLSVFKKFKLVQKWSDKMEDLVSALETSAELELDDKKKKIRRKSKLTATKWDILKRTTMIHGFTFAKNKTNLQSMKEFFQTWGEVHALFPRKQKKKQSKDAMPKGSVKIIWSDEPTAENFRQMKSVDYKDQQFTISQLREWDNFDRCFRLDGVKNFDSHKNLKAWLTEHNVKTKRVEPTEKYIYIWGQDSAKKAVDILGKIEDSDKKYGAASAIVPEEYDLVYETFKKFVIKSYHQKKHGRKGGKAKSGEA